MQGKSPAEAMAAYSQAVTSIVGASNTETMHLVWLASSLLGIRVPLRTLMRTHRDGGQLHQHERKECCGLRLRFFATVGGLY